MQLISEGFSLGSNICRWIWKARNDKVFNQITWDVQAISSKALASFNKFKATNVRDVQVVEDSQTSQEGIAVWRPPQGDYTKINADAAVDENRNLVGIGII